MNPFPKTKWTAIRNRVKTRIDLFACALSGVLLALCFPPWNLAILAWIAPVPMLTQIRAGRSWRNVRYGMLTGAVSHTIGLYWLYHVTTPGLLVLLVYLSALFAAPVVAYGWVRDRWHAPAVFGLTWAAAEYARSLGAMSFEWNYLGHALYGAEPFGALAPLSMGVYALTFLAACGAAVIAGAARDAMEKRFRWKLRAAQAGVWAGACALATIPVMPQGTDPQGESKTVRVAMIQGNFSQEEKENTPSREAIDVYLDLSGEALRERPDLIVWPESAITVPINYSPEIVERIVEFTRLNDVEMLVGAVYGVYEGDAKWKFWNRAILFQPETPVDLEEYPIDLDAFQSYDKIHLIPYGEWIPLGGYWPFYHIETLIEEAGAGLFERGEEQTVFRLRNGAAFTMAICFESTRSGQLRRAMERGADFLVNITNDAWFFRSPGLSHHFQQMAYRAAENRCYAVRAANTGLTGIIGPDGEVREIIPDNRAGYCFGELTIGSD